MLLDSTALGSCLSPHSGQLLTFPSALEGDTHAHAAPGVGIDQLKPLLIIPYSLPGMGLVWAYDIALTNEEKSAQRGWVASGKAPSLVSRDTRQETPLSFPAPHPACVNPPE